MSRFLLRLLETTMPIVGMVVFVVFFIVGIFIFSYLLIIIAIIGLILFIIAFIRIKIVEYNGPKEPHSGRIIEHCDDKEK